jgi:hypothetical protein
MKMKTKTKIRLVIIEMVLSRQIELVSILWDIIFLQGHLYTIITGPFTVIIARLYGNPSTMMSLFQSRGARYP